MYRALGNRVVDHEVQCRAVALVHDTDGVEEMTTWFDRGRGNASQGTASIVVCGNFRGRNHFQLDAWTFHGAGRDITLAPGFDISGSANLHQDADQDAGVVVISTVASANSATLVDCWG